MLPILFVAVAFEILRICHSHHPPAFSIISEHASGVGREIWT